MRITSPTYLSVQLPQTKYGRLNQTNSVISLSDHPTFSGPYDPTNREEVWKERLRRIRESNGNKKKPTSAEKPPSTKRFKLPQVPSIAELIAKIKTEEAKEAES